MNKYLCCLLEMKVTVWKSITHTIFILKQYVTAVCFYLVSVTELHVKLSFFILSPWAHHTIYLFSIQPKHSLFQVVWANDQHCHLFQERTLLDAVLHLFLHTPVKYKTAKIHLMVGVWNPSHKPMWTLEREIIQPCKMAILCIPSYVILSKAYSFL